jgi:hypothetical protein
MPLADGHRQTSNTARRRTDDTQFGDDLCQDAGAVILTFSQRLMT